MIICDYSTDEMYREYKNGTPISEIVRKTGMKRKTWNKRFERFKKKNNLATINNKNNNYSELIIQENKANNNTDNSAIINSINGDNGDKLAQEVAGANTFDSKGGTCEDENEKVDSTVYLFIILLIIGLILLFKWIYDKWKFIKNEE